MNQESRYPHDASDLPGSDDAARVIHVTWEGPVFDLSGYAASSRAALRGLERAGVRLRLIPAPFERRRNDENRSPH